MDDALHLAATDLAVKAQDGDTLDRIAAQLDRLDAARTVETLAEAALRYARAGVAVFPLVARGKRPLIPAVHPKGSRERARCKGECGSIGHGLHDASTDPEQVAAWWERNPQANIGAATGRTFDVVDIDGTAGVLSIAGNAGTPDYISALRERAIGVVSTPRPGGMHYYVPPAGRKSGAGSLLPHVDTRADGGYVVLPPSVTDEHGPGRRYTWLRPLVAP